MNSTKLKYRQQTGMNATTNKQISVFTENFEVPTDEYVEWLEERVDLNFQAIAIIKDLVRRCDELGSSAHFWPCYESGSNLLSKLKALG